MKIPFGLRVADELMVSPAQVPNGLRCGCICAECNQLLIARQGQIKEWHFAHAAHGDCPGAVETAIHRMAKQMIMVRRAIFLPAHTIRLQIGGPTWKAQLQGEVQVAGLVELKNCQEEVRIGTRQPDILAVLPNGTPLAIEVAFSHFCEQEKIDWLKECNLTTLEIDIAPPPDAKASEVEGFLSQVLFKSAAQSMWLHHAGEAAINVELNEQERMLREQHAAADAAERRREAKRQDEAKRKAEFLERTKDIVDHTYRITNDLTLRIAHSRARVTMKGHGYFAGIPDYMKQIVNEAGQTFGGKFNKQYYMWEFWTDEDHVYPLYRDLCKFVEARIWPEAPASVASESLQVAPVSAASLALRFDLEGDEVEIFQERAGIVEFESGCSRDEAEQMAFNEILERRERS